MVQSTITEKFQTTIPLAVRRALKLKPHQRVSYEVRPDGSAVLRPFAGLDELFGSLKAKHLVRSTSSERQATRQTISRETSGEQLRLVPECRANLEAGRKAVTRLDKLRKAISVRTSRGPKLTIADFKSATEEGRR